MSARLGAVGRPLQAQIDDFKVRLLPKQDTSVQRHLYMTEWNEIEMTAAPTDSSMLVIGDERPSEPCELLPSTAASDQLQAKA